MSRGSLKVFGLALAVLAGATTPVMAQGTLDEVAQRARSAWMTHDAGTLAGAGDTLSLRLPGVEEATVTSSQASRLLSRFFQPSAERSFEFSAIRPTGEEQGYAEASRRYVVKGTADEVTERVFLGFRRVGGRWRLTEIRVTP
jgi:hypothetical protein